MRGREGGGRRGEREGQEGERREEVGNREKRGGATGRERGSGLNLVRWSNMQIYSHLLGSQRDVEAN